MLKDLRLVSYFSKGKRWLILCFCIILALIIWLLQTLNGTYTKSITMEVAPVKLPAKYAIDNRTELPQQITVDISANGNALLAFSLGQLFGKVPMLTLEIDSTRLSPDGGYWSANTPEIIRQIRRSYPDLDDAFGYTADRIIVRPDYIGFSYAPLDEQILPIVFNSQIDFGSEKNRFLKSFKMSADEVLAYGLKTKLDSLALTNSVIYTDTTVIISDQEGINKLNVALLAPEGITLAQDSVEVQLVIQDLKYHSYFEPDIAVYNLPDHMNIRLFPSTLKVTYLSEEGVEEGAIKKGLKLYVDLKDLEESSLATKLRVKFNNLPSAVHMIQLEPDEVEFILEER